MKKVATTSNVAILWMGKKTAEPKMEQDEKIKRKPNTQHKINARISTRLCECMRVCVSVPLTFFSGYREYDSIAFAFQTL